MKPLLRFALALGVWVMSLLPLAAQKAIWKPILAMNDYEQVEDTPTHIYLVANGSLFGIEKKRPDHVHLYGHADGLTDNRISRIYYEASAQQLFIYYLSGKMDVLSPQGVVSNTALYDNYRLADKKLHRLVADEGKVYLAGGFGISRVSLERAHIEATYFLGSEVRDVARLGSVLYALRPDGSLFRGDEARNLQDPSEWTRVTLPNDTSQLVQIAPYKGDLLLLRKGGALYRLPKGEGTPTLFYSGIENLLREHKTTLLQGKKNLILLDEEQAPRPLSFRPDLVDLGAGGLPSELWLATSYSIERLTLSGSEESGEGWKPQYDSPWDNNYFYTLLSGTRFYAVSGGRGGDRSYIRGCIKIQDGVHPWAKITSKEVQWRVEPQFYDVVSLAVDPLDPKHFFASTWGEGLLEFRNDELVQQYSLDNSPLSSAIPNRPYSNSFVRVGSLSFDSKGGLWMFQGSVGKNILYLDAKGNWYKFEEMSVRQVNAFGPSLVLPGDIVWSTIEDADKTGVVIVDINGTPDNTSDDVIRNISQFVDRSGRSIATRTFYCMALDREGVLWLGSDKGPIIVNAPTRVHKATSPMASRPVGGVEPNLYYVLDNVRINALAVDRLNNKWVGTASDGLYLLSSDGTQILAHYRAEDSPLLSNSINTLSLDNTTGLLYIGTSEGLITLQTGNFDTTKESLSSIHVYPNPLRPEDPDLVTITGLNTGMELRITNAQGGLVHSDVATGSEYPLTVRSSSGERYAPGVYSVLISDPKSHKATVVRFAVL